MHHLKQFNKIVLQKKLVNMADAKLGTKRLMELATDAGFLDNMMEAYCLFEPG